MVHQEICCALGQSVSMPQESAHKFLNFLEKRRVQVVLYTQRGNTNISLPQASPAEAQKLLAEWQAIAE